jgi:peptidyl-prolyl cis-trans isomerase A (cyclophilin A)
MSFPPFGRVIEGMDVVDSLYAGYGEGAPNGRGPTQRAIQTRGNAYLDRDFPKLDFIKKATILKDVSGNDQDKDNQDKDK